MIEIRIWINILFDSGVCHADENLLLFSSGLLPAIHSKEDLKVSETLIDFWTSFARDG